jgi:hypothetical protein
VHNPSEIIGDDLNNLRHALRIHFINETREYLKQKSKGLAVNRKHKNIRPVQTN